MTTLSYREVIERIYQAQQQRLKIERRLIRYLIAGTIGVACVAFTPAIVRCAFANDSSRDYYASRDDRRREAMRAVGGGSVCCSAQGYTFYGLWRYGQPMWKLDVLHSLASDISHIFGWDEPLQRGAYTDGGPIMGTGARQLAGPGGTIGPI